MKFDLLIKDAWALLSHPKNPWELVEEQVDIGILGEQITAIGSLKAASAHSTFKASGLVVLPGLIDTQVHFREPGMEHKETIESGSRAALLGGISAFLEMPNTIPPTLSKETFKDKIQRAENNSWCDFAFFMGASSSNLSQLSELEKQRGCCGVKIFMGKSTGSLLLDKESDILQALQNTSGPVAIHSEDQERLNQRKKLILSDPNVTVQKHPVWRDVDSALIATKKIIRLAKECQRRVHILHVTTEEEMSLLKQHQTTATVEVTPQHLTLAAPECYERLGSLAQMNPPIRDKRHQQALWQAVREGVVTMIGSDHAPHSLEEKKQAYPLSPAGMPGTQTMLPLMLNHVHKKQLSLKKLTELLAVNPHRYYGIQKQGLIKKHFKANLTFVDIKKTQTITQKWLASKCDWSPFENQKVTGWPEAVLLSGQWAMQNGELISSPKGKMLSFRKKDSC